MTTDNDPRPWPKVGWPRRFGPVAVVLAVLVAVGVVSTVKTTSSSSSASSNSEHQQAVSGDPTKNPNLPITYAEAKAKGTVGKYDWGPNCDPATGRIKIRLVYAPPCTPVLNGNNGGATWNGVDSKTIRVVEYIPPATDLLSAFQAQLDPMPVQQAAAQQVVDMLNKVMPLYGRHVQLIRYQSNGISTDETVARADAIKVADDLHAFASIGGPAQTSAYEQELAARHVVCIGCGAANTDKDYARDAPYAWGTSATPDQLLTQVFDAFVKTRKGKATFAGDPSMHNRQRVIGVVNYEQNPPIYGSLTAKLNAKYGPPKVRETYILDLSKLPERATTIIGQLKANHVTTVIFIGDPIMPIYLTKAATAQNYFPEWIETGTVLTDTTTLGRLYDQKQWAHAFGVSSLGARMPKEQSDAYQLYRWFYGTDPQARKTIQLIEAAWYPLFLGMSMAGPHLTPLTFEGGMFKYPPTGGGPTHPRISYGHHVPTATPAGDFVGVDDITFVWWDPTVHGPDEQGTVGNGAYRYVDGGKRYLPGHSPTQLPFFQEAGTVVTYDQSPPGDRAPNYPPWPGSPAAQRAGH